MIDIKVVTQKGTYLETSVKSIACRSVEGQMTILPNHMPIFANLVPCKLDLKNENDEVSNYAVAGGFLYFSDNKAMLLTDAIEGKKDIDLKRAQEAEKRARERLEKRDSQTNMKRAQLSLQRAINRIHVYND